MRRISSIVLALAAVAMASAQRAPTVTFTTSGGPGNYTLDFTLQNNFNQGEGQFYFFGVYFDTGRNIAGNPSNGYWDSNAWTSWNNSGYGGSNTNYNNNWIDFSYPTGTVYEGTSMNGFQAIYTGSQAPTRVQWFAFATGGTYGGNDYFNNPNNPGFEGIGSPVPEPASLAALGLGALVLIRRRRR